MKHNTIAGWWDRGRWPDDESASDVYVANLAARSVTRVFENSGHARLTGVTWSPDGTRFGCLGGARSPRGH